MFKLSKSLDLKNKVWLEDKGYGWAGQNKIRLLVNTDALVYDLWRIGSLHRVIPS